MKEILELKNVSYENDNKTILQDISLSVDRGEFISVTGPSGSGKSTFLRLCSSLISPTRGGIFFDGRNYEELSPVELRKKITYCFQTPYLFGKTVKDNVVFPYSVRNIKPDLSKAEELFSVFNMPEGFLNEDVQNLSGGEKQRIALIRSLIFRPEILLLDEVTSALDADNANTVVKAVADLNKEGMTVVWVTHSPDQIKEHADRVITIENGRLISIGEVKK